MLTSKGMAGVPRASLVVIAATLASFNLPEAGPLLFICIDPVLDMGRSAPNGTWNSLSAAGLAQWVGERDDCASTPATPQARARGGVSGLMRSRSLLLGFAFTVAAALPGAAQDNLGALSGTLKKIKDTGTITLGYRESSLPFSYPNHRQQPIGYSLDLCREVVE